MLTIDEVFGLAKEGRDMKEVVSERRSDYEGFAKLPAYSRLVFAGKVFDKADILVKTFRNDRSARILVGTPCSAGDAQGEALVIRNVNDVSDVKGKILISKMTDPGWVFLLASAAGVVSEKGSLLSHTAIISRELGIPAVTGVADATDLIRTGDIIRIDGTSGKIEILEKAQRS